MLVIESIGKDSFFLPIKLVLPILYSQIVKVNISKIFEETKSKNSIATKTIIAKGFFIKIKLFVKL
jgi:hypothetical protein